VGHVKALGKIAEMKEKGADEVKVYNLGTGKGVSVLELVHAFEKVIGRPLPYEIKPRRAGDIAACYADPSKAKRELDWEAKRGIEDMCRDSWNWQSNNPNGYES
jgi:UDP-glucose 4-epimerase